MNNVDKFLERLKTFKPLIDDGKIPKKSFDATRSYLELPHFNRYAFALPQPALPPRQEYSNYFPKLLGKSRKQVEPCDSSGLQHNEQLQCCSTCCLA